MPVLRCGAELLSTDNFFLCQLIGCAKCRSGRFGKIRRFQAPSVENYFAGMSVAELATHCQV